MKAAIYQPNMVLSFTHTKSPDQVVHTIFAQNKDDAAIEETQFLEMIHDWGNQLLASWAKQASNGGSKKAISVKPAEICLTFSKTKKAISVIVLGENGTPLEDYDVYAIVIAWSKDAQKLVRGMNDDTARVQPEMQS